MRHTQLVLSLLLVAALSICASFLWVKFCTDTFGSGALGLVVTISPYAIGPIIWAMWTDLRRLTERNDHGSK